MAAYCHAKPLLAVLKAQKGITSQWDYWKWESMRVGGDDKPSQTQWIGVLWDYIRQWDIESIRSKPVFIKICTCLIACVSLVGRCWVSGRCRFVFLFETLTLDSTITSFLCCGMFRNKVNRFLGFPCLCTNVCCMPSHRLDRHDVISSSILQ